MSDDRSQNPDSLPGTDNDPRSDIEQAVQSRSDDVERAGTQVDKTSALEPTGIPDGVAGTGGVTKNQEDLQQ